MVEIPILTLQMKTQQSEEGAVSLRWRELSTSGLPPDSRFLPTVCVQGLPITTSKRSLLEADGNAGHRLTEACWG